jgi:hypothetical protein
VQEKRSKNGVKAGVDGDNQKPHNLPPLLLTNTTLRQTNPAGSLKINSR